MSGTVHHLKPPGAQRRQVALSPDEYELTAELRKWAADHGVNQVDARFEHFVDYCRNRRQAYQDYAAAFRNACRVDWAKLGMPVPLTRCAICRKPTSAWIQRQVGRVCNQCDRQATL
jgi:hypothetical protein